MSALCYNPDIPSLGVASGREPPPGLLPPGVELVLEDTTMAAPGQQDRLERRLAAILALPATAG
jgi:hypothetical protein